MSKRLPYRHSPEEEQPWTIHLQPRRVLSERRLPNGSVFRRVEALPTDPMFGRLHVAFLNDPEEDDEEKPKGG